MKCKKTTDLTDPCYWKAMIKMSLSRFFVLMVLDGGSMHGYGIAKEVDRITCGCCSPTEGSLYPALKEFEANGYVTATEEVVNGRTRKIYTLTDAGKTAYKVATTTWLDVTRHIEKATDSE